MKKLIPVGMLGIAGMVSVGLLALPTSTVAAGNTEYAKREDDVPELVLVADDDDDDTNLKKAASRSKDSRSRNSRSRNTGNSRSRNDNTNSRFTKVSKDRDWSRGDKTKDWTNDGPGKKKRDWSANKTNDRSRNDTRRR